MISQKTTYQSSLLNKTFDTEESALAAEREFMTHLLESLHNEECVWHVRGFMSDEVCEHLDNIKKLIITYFCIYSTGEIDSRFFMAERHRDRMNNFCRMLMLTELDSPIYNMSIRHAIYLKPVSEPISSPDYTDLYCGRVDRITTAMEIIDPEVHSLVPSPTYTQGLVLVCKVPNWSSMHTLEDVWCVITHADIIINRMKSAADSSLNAIIK